MSISFHATMRSPSVSKAAASSWVFAVALSDEGELHVDPPSVLTDAKIVLDPLAPVCHVMAMAPDELTATAGCTREVA